MALIDKLTNIADAIRGKTGSADKLTLDGMATAIAGIQTGGGSAMYSGEFTPAANVLEVNIDIGGTFTHFVVQSSTVISSPGAKYTSMICVNDETKRGSTTMSNNAGTAPSGFELAYRNGKYESGSTNSYIQINGNSIYIKCATSGNVLGHFIGGITYNWYAW